MGTPRSAGDCGELLRTGSSPECAGPSAQIGHAQHATACGSATLDHAPRRRDHLLRRPELIRSNLTPKTWSFSTFSPIDLRAGNDIDGEFFSGSLFQEIRDGSNLIDTQLRSTADFNEDFVQARLTHAVFCEIRERR
jgi:uncharacterized protein YjbI with pentapeptide repeats